MRWVGLYVTNDIHDIKIYPDHSSVNPPILANSHQSGNLPKIPRKLAVINILLRLPKNYGKLISPTGKKGSFRPYVCTESLSGQRAKRATPTGRVARFVLPGWSYMIKKGVLAY